MLIPNGLRKMTHCGSRRRRPAPVQLLLIVVTCLASSVVAQASDWSQLLDGYLESEFERSSLPGMAVAVVSGEQLLYARGFGEARVGAGEVITPHTSFEIGSLTKSMTALAILQLEERGLLSLDDPVRRHLHWFRVASESASREITLRHLLTHESGLPTSSHTVVWQDFDRIDPSVEEGVRALAAVELEGRPGHWFAYANMGYATLGAVIETVSGESWFEYIENHILTPLAMNESGTTIASQAALTMARPHTWRLGSRVEVGSIRPFLAPSGSMQTASALDMGTYLQSWLRPQEGGVVTPRAAAQATEPLAHVGDEYFGFGWITTEDDHEGLHYHTGDTAGSAAYMALLPERDLGIIVLANAMSTLAPKLGQGIIDIVQGDAPAPIGADLAATLSRLVAAVAVAGFLMLALLGLRVAHVLRKGFPGRSRTTAAVRAVSLSLFAAAAWIILPKVLEEAGLPAPFGMWGYPFDFAVGSVALLSVSTLWAIYGLASLRAASGTAHQR